MTRTDTASRLIAATSDAVFDALVDRDALTSWLPPRTMTMTWRDAPACDLAPK